jgi:hypothetical protein
MKWWLLYELSNPYSGLSETKNSIIDIHPIKYVDELNAIGGYRGVCTLLNYKKLSIEEIEELKNIIPF